jgi:hypothetical protein
MRWISCVACLSLLGWPLLLPSSSSAATPTTLYTFGSAPDGANPEGPLAVGKNGALYGTTEYGGAYGYEEPPSRGVGYGTVFSLTPPMSPGGAWTKTTLWNFGGTTADGAYPVGGLAIGPNGTLYGVTTATLGGDGVGTVFSLTPPPAAGGSWTETVLHNFGTASNDGWYGSDLVMGARGVLYGTTLGGGAYGTYCGVVSFYCGGTVFSLSPPGSEGGTWTESVLWAFGGFQGDGIAPSSVVIGGDGVLYGTTEVGGPYYVPPYGGCADAPRGKAIYCEGTVFSLTPPTAEGEPWTENVLWSFGGPDSTGSWPNGVVVGSGGVLYGTTRQTSKVGVFGTVFSLSPPSLPGGAWSEQDIHGFLANGAQSGGGGSPYGSLLIGESGALYGTTFDGGDAGVGAIFVLRPPASPAEPWAPATLWDFEAGSGGQCPAAGLVMSGHGVLYGTTSGTYCGPVASVFELTP